MYDMYQAVHINPALSLPKLYPMEEKNDMIYMILHRDSNLDNWTVNRLDDDGTLIYVDKEWKGDFVLISVQELAGYMNASK